MSDSAVAGDALSPGTMVGEYRVEKKLGEGGMGAVFAAVHPRIGKKVAIKVLNRAMAGSPELVQRFENEARAVNEIGHRNIVDIFAFGQLPDGSPYFVMEWLLGADLDTHLRAVGKLPFDEAMAIVRQVCKALSAAHAKGIVHRDLKPENIYLCDESEVAHFVKLLDFGIAKFHAPDQPGKTRTGMMMGTPYFMSPEQARGRAVDHRTDIYAMGVILFRMFTGRFPFQAESTMEIITQHLTEAAPKPSAFEPGVTGALEDIILKALEKEPGSRQQTVDELLASLEACAPAATPAAGTASASDKTILGTPSTSSPPAGAPAIAATIGAPAIAATIGAPPRAAPQAAAAAATRAPVTAPPAEQASAVTAPPAEQASVVPVPSRRKVWPIIAAVVVVLAIAGGAVALFSGGGSSTASGGDPASAPAGDMTDMMRMPAPKGFKRGAEIVPLGN